MKTHLYIAAAVLVLAVAAIWLLLPAPVRSAQAATTATTTVVYVDKPTLSPSQVIWLAHLMECESGINRKAVLAVDRDGTPSIGILQFKQGTFDAWAKDYDLEGDIYDGTTQVAIVTQWILHPGTVDWTWQFPDCVHKYGVPPGAEVE